VATAAYALTVLIALLLPGSTMLLTGSLLLELDLLRAREITRKKVFGSMGGFTPVRELDPERRAPLGCGRCPSEIREPIRRAIQISQSSPFPVNARWSTLAPPIVDWPTYSALDRFWVRRA
jgi:hypothetical protein